MTERKWEAEVVEKEEDEEGEEQGRRGLQRFANLMPRLLVRPGQITNLKE